MALFGNQDKQIEAELSNSNTTISKGTTLRGDLETYGTVRIDGNQIGNISARAKVALGKGSKVNGNILAKTAEIEGTVEGEIRIEDKLILRPSAVVTGSIFTKRLEVEDGSKWNGDITMGDNIEPAKALPKASSNINGKQEKATA
jgi:cytoskeletal protein CcmA (bactofilin family)